MEGRGEGREGKREEEERREGGKGGGGEEGGGKGGEGEEEKEHFIIVMLRKQICVMVQVIAILVCMLSFPTYRHFPFPLRSK